MSLALVQEYSSDEGEEEILLSDEDDGGKEDEKGPSPARVVAIAISKNVFSLPSPEDLFSEVTGPPEFLKSAAREPINSRIAETWEPLHGMTATPARHSNPGANPEMKRKLPDSYEQTQGSSEDSSGDSKDVPHRDKGGGAVAQESTSALPRLYSSAELKNATDEVEKRNRLKIKDKEKSKRMKGQSSHATWKSETEMYLRQQFD